MDGNREMYLAFQGGLGIAYAFILWLIWREDSLPNAAMDAHGFRVDNLCPYFGKSGGFASGSDRFPCSSEQPDIRRSSRRRHLSRSRSIRRDRFSLGNHGWGHSVVAKIGHIGGSCLGMWTGPLESTFCDSSLLGHQSRSLCLGHVLLPGGRRLGFWTDLLL